MKHQRLFILAVLCLLVSVSTAQQFIVRAILDTNRALIGDQVTLHLSVEKPLTLQLGFPALKDTLTRNLEIISMSSVDTTFQSAGRITLIQDIVIAAFDTGLFEIPPLSFAILSGNHHDTASTLPVFLEIVPVAVDSTIRDIKDIASAPINLAEVLYYAGKHYPYGLLAAGFIVLAFLLIRYYRKKKGRQMPLLNITDEPADVIALRELDKLMEDKPWMNNKVKPYYIRVSEILRTYIEHRFHCMALEQTTEEILLALKTGIDRPEDLQKLSAVLKLADLVKFAKVIPEADENAAQIGLAAEFVHNTAKQPDDKEITQNNQVI